MPSALQILAYTSGGAIGLALLESVAQFAVRRSQYFVFEPGFSRILGLDSSILPNLHERARFFVNSIGERGSEEPTDDFYKVIVIGGSAAECAIIDQAHAWPLLMQDLLVSRARRLRPAATAVHVGVLAKSGFDVEACGEVLKRVLPQYRCVDEVWFMVGPGDVVRWLELGAPSDASLPPVPVDSLFDQHPLARFSLRPFRPAIRALAARLLRTVRPTVVVKERAGGWIRRAREMRQSASRIVEQTPSHEAFLARFERNFERTLRVAQESGARIVVIQQPRFRKERFSDSEEAMFWNGGVGNAFRGDHIREFFSTDVMYGLFDSVDSVAKRVCGTLGIEYVPTLDDIEMNEATFYDHIHLTEAGGLQLVRALAQRLP